MGPVLGDWVTAIQYVKIIILVLTLYKGQYMVLYKII